ncbi:MAG: TolC family protein [FCB group bacterium]|nr:TolC family protein [FCB group bacterium]
MRKTLGILYLLGIILPIYIYGAERPLELTLDQAIQLALRNNVNLHIAEEDWNKAQAQSREAKASALPVISGFAQQVRNLSIAKQPITFPVPFGVLDASGNPVPLPGDPTHQMTDFVMVDVDIPFGNDNLFVYGLSLTQPLFDGRVIAALRSAGAYSKMASAALEAARLRIIEQTKIGFYQALLTQRVVEVMEASLQLVKQSYRDAQALYKQGKAAEFDLIRAEVQVANQESQLSNARKTASFALAGLKRVCGLSQETNLILVGEIAFQPPFVPDYETLEQQLLDQQPLLVQLEAANKLTKENILMRKSEFMPSLALTGSYQQQLPFDDGEFKASDFREASSVGLSLNLPLFNGFGSKARLDQAKAEYQKSVYTLQDVKENLLVELSNLYLSMKEARKRINAGEKNVEQAKKGVEIARQLYSKGMATQLEVMDANNARNQAELGLAQAYFEFHSALAALSRAVGVESIVK